MNDSDWTAAEWNRTPPGPNKHHLPADRIFRSYSRERQAEIQRETDEWNAIYDEWDAATAIASPNPNPPEDVFGDDDASPPYTDRQNDIMEVFADAQVLPARRTGGYEDDEPSEPPPKPALVRPVGRRPATWGFDTLGIEWDAKVWLDRMESGRLVLLSGGSFKRAVCGLEDEPGHKHTRLCAGPSAAERRLQYAMTRRA